METIATSKRTELILIGGLAIAVLFYPVVGHLVFLGQKPGLTTFWYSRFFIWLMVALLFVYARKVEHNRFILWPEKRYGFWFYPASFAALYLLYLGCGTVAILPKLLFGFHDNHELMDRMLAIMSKSWPLIIFTCVTAGFTEELAFRAYMVPRLEIIFKNKYMPVILSALFFSANHYRYFSLQEIIMTFCLGIVFAIHYQWYRNIKILIVTHILIDLIAISAHLAVQAYQLKHHLHHTVSFIPL